MTAGMKICKDPQCLAAGKPQPEANFYRNSKAPDGRSYYCKTCVKLLPRESYQRCKKRVAPVDPGRMKVCSHPDCPASGEPQPVENFYAHPASRDGLQGWCISCVKRYNKAYYSEHQNGVQMKRCPRCPDKGLLPAEEEFYHNASTSDGYATYCKECMKKFHRSYYKRKRKRKRKKQRKAATEQTTISSDPAEQVAQGIDDHINQSRGRQMRDIRDPGTMISEVDKKYHCPRCEKYWSTDGRNTVYQSDVFLRPVPERTCPRHQEEVA